MIPEQKQRVKAETPRTQTEMNREYVSGRLSRMYAAALEADKASKGWNRRSIELDAYLELRGLNWAQRKLERDRDPELNDWFSKWSFWERETKRNAQVIEAMKAGRELLGLPVPFN